MWSAVAGAVLKPVLGIVDKAVPDKDLREQLRTQISMALLEQGGRELAAQVKVILAEAQGSWMQRNWRPGLMWVVVLILANNFLVSPYVNALLGEGTLPVLDLPERLYNLLTVGLGGYVVGRSAEKVAERITINR